MGNHDPNGCCDRASEFRVFVPLKSKEADLIADDAGLKTDFAVFISGQLVRGAVDWGRAVADSEQIHVCDWPMIDS